MKDSFTYEKAGVSLKRANEAVSRIKALVKKTHQSSVLYDICLLYTSPSPRD